MNQKSESKFVKTSVDDQPMSSVTSKSLLERLLTPQNLNLMMGSGAMMLVIGFVVWLWSVGIFDNPLIAAMSLGVGNLTLLGFSVWLYQATRFKLAGNGMLLLSSILLPLNLWFYDSQGLLELNQGDPLWIPALACCAIFAFVGRLTRNPQFAYSLVGGVILSGLLFLAGPGVGLIWQPIPTSVFLVVVSSLAIFSERWFSADEGPFSRDQFGLAFFNAGHWSLLAALALLSTQLMFSLFNIQWLMSRTSAFGQLELMSAAGILAFTCGIYFYSAFVRKQWAFQGLGVVSLVASALVLGDVLGIRLTVPLAGLIFSTLMVAMNLIIHFRKASKDESQPVSWANLSLLTWAVIANAAVALCWFFQTDNLFNGNSGFIPSIVYLFIAGLACLTVPRLWIGDQNRFGFSIIRWLGAITVSIAACFSIGYPAALVAMSERSFFIGGLAVAAITMVLTFGLPKLGIQTRQERIGNTLAFALLAAIGTSVGWACEYSIGMPTAASILTSIIASATFLQISHLTQREESLIAAIVCFVLTGIQLFVYFQLTDPFMIVAALTMGGLVVYLPSRIARAAAKRHSKDSLAIRYAGVTSNVGSSLIICGSGASVLMLLTAFASDGADWSHVTLIAFNLLVSILIGITEPGIAWRQSFRLISVIQGIALMVAVGSLSENTFWEKAQLASLVIGAVVTMATYVGWSKEKQGQENGLITFGFFAGSVTLVIPLFAGFIGTRFWNHYVPGEFWFYLNEIGTLAIGLILLGSGIMTRVRSTTFGGAILCLTVVGGLVALIRIPSQLNSAAIIMMIGGGIFFGTAILLSFYRDWLVSLPERIKQRKGLFQVMKWR
ncbi:MAG: hypothetical protein AAF623_17465 [Planctomycetota bacterium]